MAMDAAIIPVPGSAVAQMVALTEVAALLLGTGNTRIIEKPLTGNSAAR
jgi:hypothetical protein